MSDELNPVCILAGGLGSRLGLADRPKALAEVAGQPFLFHQLALLAAQGARRVVLCVGYLGEQITDAVGDGQRFGLEVLVVSDGPEPAGTARAVRGALEHMGDQFLVLYGDTYLRIDYRAVQAAHRLSGRAALMTVLRNEGRWGTSNADYADGMVVRYDKRIPDPSMAWIDYGLSVLTPDAMRHAPEADDLAEVFRVLSREGELAGYVAAERFYEIGTPSALSETESMLRGSPIVRGSPRLGR